MRAYTLTPVAEVVDEIIERGLLDTEAVNAYMYAGQTDYRTDPDRLHEAIVAGRVEVMPGIPAGGIGLDWPWTSTRDIERLVANGCYDAARRLLATADDVARYLDVLDKQAVRDPKAIDVCDRIEGVPGRDKLRALVPARKPISLGAIGRLLDERCCDRAELIGGLYDHDPDTARQLAARWSDGQLDDLGEHLSVAAYRDGGSQTEGKAREWAAAACPAARRIIEELWPGFAGTLRELRDAGRRIAAQAHG